MRDGLLSDLWKEFRIILRGLAGMVASLLFLWSAGIHLATWVYPDIAGFLNPLLWTHAAVLICCAVYSLSCDKAERARSRNRDSNSPAWVQAFSTALFGYLFVSIAYSVFGGMHKSVADAAVDSVSQTIPLEKPSKWYSHDDLFGLRLASIFWMLFSFHLAAESFYRKFTTRFGRYDAVVKRI